MRWSSLACVAVLLLAGCSSKPEPAAEALAVPSTGSDGPVAANVTAVTMRFAGGDQEAELAISESFAPSDSCTIGFPDCPAASYRSIDLTSLLPAQAPVELSVDLDVNSNFNVYVSHDEATTMLQYSQEYSGPKIRIDTLLVRGEEGVVTLEILNAFPAAGAWTAQAATIQGTAHSVSRAGVVPAYMPVSVRLGPGDNVTATGDGLEQFVAFPPTGPAIRATQYPFEIKLADDAPTGEYLLIAVADEAVKLMGPNQTLSARRLVYMETDPVPLPMGQAVDWEFPIAGHPVRIGVAVQNVQTVPGCCGTAGYAGSMHLRVTSPENVDVVVEDTDCLPLTGCPLAIMGNFDDSYMSSYLDEHLSVGTYTAAVTVDQGNNVEGYAWAMVIE